MVHYQGLSYKTVVPFQELLQTTISSGGGFLCVLCCTAEDSALFSWGPLAGMSEEGFVAISWASLLFTWF